MGKLLYFIWKNEDCRSKGIRLATPIPIVRPEERVKHVEIPGRSGDLTQLEGENIFNSYIQTASIMVPGWFNVREVYSWLRGSGFVTFHGEPDRRQMARIIGAITLNKHSHNLDWWVGEVQFYCQPLKELLSEPLVTVTSSGTVVENIGDVDCKPRILATASGTEMTININGRELTISGLTSGQNYLIDCDIMDVLTADETAVLTANSEGDFPILERGDNVVYGTGWSSLRIERRERFL